MRPGTDWTPVFRTVVTESLEGGKEAATANQRKWEKQRQDAFGPVQGTNKWTGQATQERNQVEEPMSQRQKDAMRLRNADQEWIGEAVKVHQTIISIVSFLKTIRRPYLVNHSTGRIPPVRRSDSHQDTDPLSQWSKSSSLTDKERDEMEFQVRMTIKRCLARIHELEEGEAVRKRTTPSLSANPFSRLLGAASTSAFPGRSHPLYAEQLSQHRACITQFLGKELAETNARLGDMQEARVRAQRIKQINLAGSANTGGPDAKRRAVPGSVRDVGSTSSVPSEELLDRPLQNDFSANQLTPEQVEMFDRESSALVQSLSDDLKAVEAAERKLSEVSELQTQLIQHLGTQAELSDNLHQEALGHTLEVGKGNEQLKKAKESNRQANRFLCLFFIGSGLGLLFLHWMD